jgi:small-conductance mechanosensitive channel
LSGEGRFTFVIVNQHGSFFVLCATTFIFYMFSDLRNELEQLPPFWLNVLLAAAALVTGLIFKGVARLSLGNRSKGNDRFSLLKSIIYRLNRPFTWFLPLLTFNFVQPLMDLTPGQNRVIDKILGILLIVTFSFVLIAVVKIFEDFLYHVYDLNKSDNLRERKIRTQLQFIRKVIISIIVILAIGAVLLSFSSLRRIGTGLLTGVGVSSIIVGLAAQRSLGNLLAGLQIAFTQPLRLDDALVAEGEFGKVEEITLTYVVLRLWDERRLILPINYFLEKPFQNWTRTSSEIMGTVFLYLDYSAPFEVIRSEFKRLLEHSELWDQRVSGMQVTNTTDNTVELRFLISAANSGNAFDLRCYIRENMISFIQKNYPEALPKARAVISTDDNDLKTDDRAVSLHQPVRNDLRTNSDGIPATRG